MARDYEKILLLARPSIGDVLLATPLLHALRRRWPESAIDVLIYAGHEQILVGNPDIARQINERGVKGLLVPGSRRNPLVPDVPSFAEAGLSGDQSAFETWFGMFAPKGTPAEIVKKLNAEFAAIVKEPDFAKQYLISKGFEPVGDATDAFARFIVDDQAKGKRLVDISGVKLEQ